MPKKNLQVFKTVQEWKPSLFNLQLKKKSLGFVPTMGALHAGHLSLIHKSLEENDFTLVSIFVNPTQFDDKEDLKNYPVQTKKDVESLKRNEVDFLFLPDSSEMYRDQFCFQVQENHVSQKLCGAFRKGHFNGVLTVVLKLFNIIQPNRAYFGEKDYQQYQLIRNMVKSFFMDIQIVLCPTLRDQKGLAISSRNSHLTKEERELASFFPKTLKLDLSLQEIRKKLEEKGFQVEYVKEMEGRRLAAVKLKNIRLIDNVLYASS